MKKLLVIFMALAICCSLIACGDNSEEATSSIKSETTSSTESKTDSIVEIPDIENMTEEELKEYFSEYHFDFDEPIYLPDDES